MKDKRLIEVINRDNASRLFESYPICWVGEANKDDVYQQLKTVVRMLQSINYEENENQLKDIINKDDLSDVTMFLSEKLWLLNRKNEN